MKKTGFASPNFPKKRALDIQREGGLSHSRKHMATIGRKGGWRTQELAAEKRLSKCYDILSREVKKRADKIWTIDASKPV